MKCIRCGGTGNEPDWRPAGEQLRAAREKRGITLRALALRAKCSASFLSDLELGRKSHTGPKARQLRRLVDLT